MADLSHFEGARKVRLYSGSASGPQILCTLEVVGLSHGKDYLHCIIEQDTT